MRSSGCRAALRRSRPPGRAAIPGAPARAASGGQSSQAPVSGFAWPAARRVRSTRRVMEEAERASVRPRSGFGKMSPQSANGWRGFDRPASRPERRESAIPASTAAFRHVVFGQFAGPRPCRHADMRMRIARWRLVGVRGLRDVWRHRAAEIMQCVSPVPCNPRAIRHTGRSPRRLLAKSIGWALAGHLEASLAIEALEHGLGGKEPAARPDPSFGSGRAISPAPPMPSDWRRAACAPA